MGAKAFWQDARLAFFKRMANLVIIGDRDLFTRFSDRLTDDEIVPSLFGVLESLSAIDKDICINGHSIQSRKRQSNSGQLANQMAESDPDAREANESRKWRSVDRGSERKAGN